MSDLSYENKENLRALVKQGVEGHANGYTPKFRVMPNEVSFIHELMRTNHPGVGYIVDYPSPYEARK